VTEKKRGELREELDRLQDYTGPVMIRPCCPMCSKVVVQHVGTGLVVSSKVKATPLENGVAALQELAKSLCN
jgi:hypothetical protein